MAEDKLEKVKAVDKKSRISTIEEQLSQINQPIEGKFEAMMDKKLPEHTVAEKAVESVEEKKKESLDNVAGKKGPDQSIPTSNELVEQTKDTVNRIEKVKETLETAQVEIKRPVQRLMRNKLTHIEDSLRIATTKSGAETTKEVPEVAGEKKEFSPLTNFIDHLTHSQVQLENLGAYLESMQASNEELAPANMLAIQIKVNHVQQELEFFTNLLNKSLESTKALMNVQV